MPTAPATQPTLAYTRATLAAPADPDGKGPIRFVASQRKANRYGFALRPDGWLLDNFRANPVFLWMHNTSQPPIGRVAARQEGGELVAEVTFDPDDELAQTVERKYRAGFLNAVSVGWDFVRKDGAPIQDWWRLKPEEILSADVFYDLTEISAVPVPGDPRAVRRQHAQAMARLGRELLDLADHDDPDEREDLAELIRRELDGQLDTALVEALARVGVAVPTLTGPPKPAGSASLGATTVTIHTDPLPAGGQAPSPGRLAPPTPDPDPAPDPSAGGEPAAHVFDQSAAQVLLAALAP